MLQHQKPMNHTISIAKIMEPNNFSNKTKKFLNLSNIGGHNHPTTMLNDEKQKVTNFYSTYDCDCSHKRKK